LHEEVLFGNSPRTKKDPLPPGSFRVMRLADTCTAGASVGLGVSDAVVEEGDPLAEVHAAVSAAIVRRGRRRRPNTPVRCSTRD
jgi:predicted amidohydrolase YtcJ